MDLARSQSAAMNSQKCQFYVAAVSDRRLLIQGNPAVRDRRYNKLTHNPQARDGHDNGAGMIR